MNTFSISITEPGTVRYPLHQHSHWEIMYYLRGEGVLATASEGIPFYPGRILIVPPMTPHGSVSCEGFENISIGGSFGHLLMFDGIVAQQDSDARDGERLARLIYENRHSGAEYLSALCNAYAHFLLRNSVYDHRISNAVNRIIDEATRRFFDPCFQITDALRRSGYSEDYIRGEFKKATAMSPIGFLTKIRIDHARKLFDLYGKSLSVAEVAEACGFSDPIYFSKRFRRFTGMSPADYGKRSL